MLWGYLPKSAGHATASTNMRPPLRKRLLSMKTLLAGALSAALACAVVPICPLSKLDIGVGLLRGSRRQQPKCSCCYYRHRPFERVTRQQHVSVLDLCESTSFSLLPVAPCVCRGRVWRGPGNPMGHHNTLALRPLHNTLLAHGLLASFEPSPSGSPPPTVSSSDWSTTRHATMRFGAASSKHSSASGGGWVSSIMSRAKRSATVVSLSVGMDNRTGDIRAAPATSTIETTTTTMRTMTTIIDDEIHPGVLLKLLNTPQQPKAAAAAVGQRKTGGDGVAANVESAPAAGVRLQHALPKERHYWKDEQNVRKEIVDFWEKLGVESDKVCT